MPFISVIAHHFGTNVSMSIVPGEVDMSSEEFINHLVLFCMQDFKIKNRGKDLNHNTRAIRRLRSQCERPMARLSWEGFYTVTIDALFDDISYECSVSRTKLEDLSVDQMGPVEKFIKINGFDKQDVHHVFMFGKPRQGGSVTDPLQLCSGFRKRCRSVEVIEIE